MLDTFAILLSRLQFTRLLFFVTISTGLILLSVAGCSNLLPNKNWFPPKKKGEDSANTIKLETEDGKPMLVGDYAFVGNNQTIPVHGFGLVVNLPGTGGEDANTIHYRQVTDDLNRRGVQNIRALLADPRTAVVEIRGHMTAGIQHGDKFDVDIFLPEDTATKSLRGGYLMETRLTEMAVFSGGEGVLTGTPRARVQGPIMVNDTLATEINNPSGLKKGTILGGAVTQETRFLSLLLEDSSKSFYLVDQMSKSINHRFYLPSQRKGVANAQTDGLVFLEIHPDYAQDIPRYIRVIQSIAIHETQIQQLKRIERLREELMNPDTAQHAAFQLEAIGKNGIEPLRQALKSPDMDVQFHAATSLAYLGDGSAAKVLAEIARKEPAFRVYALNALSVLKFDLEAESLLRELLHVPSAETRYGAFRALKTRNPWDQTIRGEQLGIPIGEQSGKLDGQFSYHGIVSQAPPMVHITTKKYPEIVLFGMDIILNQPFTLDAGPVIFVNGQMPDKVEVTKFSYTGMDIKRTVSNRLDEIIRAVEDLGGTYPDIVQMLRQAENQRVLSCRLEIDCLPEPNRLYRRPGSEVMADEEEEKPASFWSRLHPKNLFTPNPGKDSSDFTGTVNLSSRD